MRPFPPRKNTWFPSKSYGSSWSHCPIDKTSNRAAFANSKFARCQSNKSLSSRVGVGFRSLLNSSIAPPNDIKSAAVRVR